MVLGVKIRNVRSKVSPALSYIKMSVIWQAKFELSLKPWFKKIRQNTILRNPERLKNFIVSISLPMNILVSVVFDITSANFLV